MLRWFALMATGFFALYGVWRFHGTPLAPHAPQPSGWLFQQFEQGVAVGMLLMAIVFILIGLAGMPRRARRLRAVSLGKPASPGRRPGQRLNVLQLRTRARAKQAFGRYSLG